MATSLINQVAGGQELPRDVVDRIMAHADGVPLFIEELTKTVLQKGLTYTRWRTHFGQGAALARCGPHVAACLADGTSGSTSCRKGGRPDRCGDRPGILIRNAAGSVAACGESPGARTRRAGAGRNHRRAWSAAVRHVCLQARTVAGRGLCFDAARPAARDPFASGRGTGEGHSRSWAGTRADCLAFCGGWRTRSVGYLLLGSCGARDRSLRAGRNGQPASQRAPPGRISSWFTGKGATKACPARGARASADRPQGIGQRGGSCDIRAGTRALSCTR